MSSYAEMICQDTDCTPEDAAMIEDIMRNDIFHSTLDWQSRAEFRTGAREAAKLLEENRELFENARAQNRALFRQMKQTQCS